MNLSALRFELKTHKFHYFLLFIVLFLAFFVRTFRTNDLLRFYYDQGRDALIVKEMIETPKPVLVGPTTGLAGILRGPAFYYLLAPAYLIGRGSPIVAALWLQLLNLFGLIFLYLATRKLYGRNAGLMAATLMGLSLWSVDLSRWLSNPSPIFLSVPLMIYGLVQIKHNIRPNFWWPVVALLLGLNLQFEIASEIWFLPAMVLLILVDKQMRPSFKTALLCVGIFLTTLLHQVIFDIRHDGILRKGIVDNFATQTTSTFSFDKAGVVARLNQYVDIYANLVIERAHDLLKIILVLFLPLLLVPTFRSTSRLPLLLLLTPVVILAFYQGNFGNFYSYYMIGTFPIFYMVLAGGMSWYWRHPALRLLPILLLFFFIWKNGVLLKNFLIAGYDGHWGPEHISLANQLQAIDWIYTDAGDKEFNTDVYVPPVIPYAYDYLFEWRGERKFGTVPKKEQVSLLYTLYEVDPPHPERLADWLLRQAGIGEVEEYKQFGGIVVQRRRRI